LLLLAVGLFGIMIQLSLGSVVNWLSRTAQWLGGLYLLFAALASLRESNLPLLPAENKSDPVYYRYASTIAIVLAAAAIRLTFLQPLGMKAPFVTFYPAVIFAALYGGLRGGLLATVLSAIFVDYFWIEPVNQLIIGQSSDWLVMMSFLLGGAMITWVIDSMLRARARATAAETQALLAAEREAASEALRENEARLRLAQESANVGIWDWMVETGELDFTPELNKLYGLPSGTIKTYQDWRDRVHPDDIGRIEESRDEAIAKHESFDLEFRGRHSSGEYRWISTKGGAIFNEAGKVIRVFGVNIDITDRKRAEEALRESEERFRVSQEHSPDGFTILRPMRDPRGGIVDFTWVYENASIARINGTEPNAVVGRRLLELFPGHSGSPILEAYIQVAETGEPRVLEASYHDDRIQTITWFRLAVVPIGGDIAVLAQDITARKQAEEELRDQSQSALRLSEQEFRSLAEAMPQIVWATRPDGWNIYFNQQWVDYTGMTMEESYGHGWNTPFHPDDQQRAWDAWQRATQYNERYSLECRLRRADGVYRWWLVRGEPMRGVNGEILKWFGTCTDIEELKRAETLLHEANALLEQRVAERTAALRESEALYRGIGESIDFGIWVCAADGRNTYASESFLKMAGLTQEQCSSFGWGDVLHPDDAERTIAAWQECVRTGGKWDIEHRFRGVDGQWHHVLARGVPIRNEQGEIINWAGINLDISRLKQAEEALRRSEARMRAVFDSLMEGIVFLNPQGGVEEVNDTVPRIHGHSLQELTDPAHDPRTQIVRGDGTPFPVDEQPALMALHTGQAVRDVEMGVPICDGTLRWRVVNAQPVRDDHGALLGAVASFFDITDRKLAEEALKASLHEKEVLLKEIHHRVKNNLQVISSLVSLQADGSKDEAVREVLKDVTYRVRSMALVHEKLYQSHDLARIDFAEYARSLLNYLWRSHGEAAANVRLTLDLEPVLLPVDTGVPCGLILNELGGNALKHAFRGRSEGEVTVALKNGADGGIRISVSDNGVGLPLGFDWREASSLGLHLVKLLSKQLRASVEVSGGNGTRFEIVFQILAEG